MTESKSSHTNNNAGAARLTRGCTRLNFFKEKVDPYASNKST